MNKIIYGAAALAAAGLTAGLIACGGTSGSAAAGCRDLAAWENGLQGGTVQGNKSLQHQIAKDAAGTQFARDFASWAAASPNNAENFGPKIARDCAAAGVPNVMSGGGPASSSSAPAPSTPAPSTPAPAPSMTAQTDNIVFSVTGTGLPSIQYGTDSSTSNPGSLGPLGDGNALPWSATMPYNPSALYYAVSAQLEGSGSIQDSVTEVVTTTCSGRAPKTESFTLATGNASGGYAIAMAEYSNAGADGNALQAESDAGC